MDDETRAAYQEVLRALMALDTLRESVRLLTDGYDRRLPTNTHRFIAQIGGWLRDEQAMMESETGEAE